MEGLDHAKRENAEQAPKNKQVHKNKKFLNQPQKKWKQ